MIGTECRKCHYTCSTCFGGSLQECVKCPSTRNLTLSICDCQDGHFNLGQSPKLANVDLESIIFPLDEPFAPPDFLYSILSQTQVHSYCYVCHKACKRCVGYSSKNCTQCYDDINLHVKYPHYSSGQCQCPDTFFMTTDIKCQSCESGCKQCISQVAGNCFECLPSYQLIG